MSGGDADIPGLIAARLPAVTDGGDLGRALEKLPQVMREAATHELTAAARRTLASHGSTELVWLVAHRKTLT